METSKNIKNYVIGDTVTSNNSFFLDKGFNGVTGVIRTLVKDRVGSWQYLIDLEDGRTLQCDDTHLIEPVKKEYLLFDGTKFLEPSEAFQKEYGIEHLEATFTEDGKNHTYGITRYPSANCCHWSFREEEEEL